MSGEATAPKRRKHQFSDAERYAVMVTHGQHCYLCRTSIDMLTFEVDHVIPEQLLDDPARLALVRHQLGRPIDFEINSYANWLPACGPCNGLKGATVFEPSAIVQIHLQRASDKASKALEASLRVVREQDLGKAMNTLKRAAAITPLTEHQKAELRPLLVDFALHHEPAPQDLVVRATPSYSVPLVELLADDGVLAIVRGPFGVGGGPSLGVTPGRHMTCGACGSRFFNGTRCVACGAQDD